MKRSANWNSRWSTSRHEAGDKVGLLFGPDDIHVMHKAVVE